MTIEVREISFRYGERTTLRGVSLEVRQGEVMGLLGPNGAGKSTLLKCIAGLLRPAEGTVHIGGREVTRIRPLERARLIGYVPQGSPDGFPFTVFETVLLGRIPHMGFSPGEEDLKAAAEAISLLELQEFAARRITELSGGERQRVLLAQALARGPEVLLLDEPTANLDLRGQLESLALMSEVARERGIATVVVLHDVNLAARFSHRLAILDRGRIFAAGEPRTVLTPTTVREVYHVNAVAGEALGAHYLVPISPA